MPVRGAWICAYMETSRTHPAFMNPAKTALLFVVLLDVMGQGLVIPVLTTILTDPSQSILPADTPTEKRQFLFGLTMGLFFLSWFFGAAFISKLSDFIGRHLSSCQSVSGLSLGRFLADCFPRRNSSGTSPRWKPRSTLLPDWSR
jgi:MFS family permease